MKERATIICTRDTKILLVARKRSRWALPGGTIWRKESPEEAARRELEEETGLVVDELKYLFLFGGVNKHHHVFGAVIGDLAIPVPRNEITRCDWFSARQVATLATSIPTREIVALTMQRAGGPRRAQVGFGESGARA
ncbi:NUDIX domain-containing protein [Caballeronia sp. M1242]|uniref:NUDIX domain-containing protein n=1 Tax=Caballeronia sp. M1242 TaxID=2814653 RepID=UPI0019D2DE35|nr:NUDIX domain-containing protein [Caballeronia sp. M1242]QSN63952.1 NUDIX domain-containing protein [Caballeronia sp. M1242]